MGNMVFAHAIRMTKSGHIFEEDDTHIALGDAWKDERGVIWGDWVTDNSGRALQMDHQDALEHCTRIGFDLPTQEEYTELGKDLSDSWNPPEPPERYGIELIGYDSNQRILPHLTAEDDDHRSYRFWAHYKNRYSSRNPNQVLSRRYITFNAITGYASTSFSYSGDGGRFNRWFVRCVARVN